MKKKMPIRFVGIAKNLMPFVRAYREMVDGKGLKDVSVVTRIESLEV